MFTGSKFVHTIEFESTIERHTVVAMLRLVASLPNANVNRNTAKRLAKLFSKASKVYVIDESDMTTLGYCMQRIAFIADAACENMGVPNWMESHVNKTVTWRDKPVRMCEPKNSEKYGRPYVEPEADTDPVYVFDDEQ